MSCPSTSRRAGQRTLEAAGEHADGVILLAGLFPEGMEFALEAIERGRARSTRTQFTRTCFLYGSLRDNDQEAIDDARTIAAWFPQIAPVYARLAGMSEELIERRHRGVRRRGVPGGRRGGGRDRDDLVRKIAFAGTPETAASKLRWLRRPRRRGGQRLPARRGPARDDRAVRRDEDRRSQPRAGRGRHTDGLREEPA